METNTTTHGDEMNLTDIDTEALAALVCLANRELDRRAGDESLPRGERLAAADAGWIGQNLPAWADRMTVAIGGR